ncbi:MAG: TfoX/Sxy family protein [Oscillospiraceae bacterium]|nr:TfoX/Sxy family protein [Oscillospiraceae bacterium]
MASDKCYLDYILDQLPPEDVTYKAMMGEYIIYYRGKIIGGIYDNRFLVKPAASAKKRMPEAEEEQPYPGAKKMLLVSDPDNREFLRELLEAMYGELPEPKPRRSRIKQEDLS